MLSVVFLFHTGPLPAVEVEQKLAEMTFETEAHEWRAERHCRAFLENGFLRIEATDGTPILSRFIDRIGGQIRVVAEIRTLTESSVKAYWTTRGSPRRSEENVITRSLTHDGQWHAYEFLLPVPDFLTSFSFRFTASEGVWEIRKITAWRHRPHPLTVRNIVPYEYKSPDGTSRAMLRYTILNDAPVPLKFRVGDQPEEIELGGRQTVDLLAPIKTEGHLAAVNVLLHPNDFPAIGYPVFLYEENGETNWIEKPLGSGRTLEVAPNGRMARLRQGTDVMAIIAPLVHRDGVIPNFDPSDRDGPLRFEKDGTKLEILVEKESVRFLIENSDPAEERLLEGPVVRLFGTLQSGLLPGVEFLGPGDVSSSEIDIVPPYNRREKPDRRWVTMPLAVLGTERGAVSLTWNDMSLSPTFASPNSFDRTADHRMSLRGRKIEATLELSEPGAAVQAASGESASLRALRRFVSERKFPEPPPAPRTAEEQYRLSLQALEGVLQSEDALQWGYAAEPEWPRRPFADMLSTVVRLRDALEINKLPKPERIVPGGADIANDTIRFLTEGVEAWRGEREESIRSILALRNPDGSFLYRTRYPEVESAATSYGHTAIRALEIMEFVRLTGSRELFDVVLQSMNYLERCEVPRGGFYRDTPLHTPDLLTAATLTWLYTWAFEFSGDAAHLERARRYAHTGLPFVWQWSDQEGNHETMLYATLPKLGGTDRALPLWFGTARPATGLVYAYALNLLARHDPAVDWQRVAVGILHTAEAMQLAEGPEAGCLPEAYDVSNRRPRSWHVNPCALVSLRMAIEGRPDSLCLLLDGPDRYVSPYPLRRTAKGIEAEQVPPDRRFQVLRNGNRISTSTGPGPLQGN